MWCSRKLLPGYRLVHLVVERKNGLCIHGAPAWEAQPARAADWRQSEAARLLACRPGLRPETEPDAPSSSQRDPTLRGRSARRTRSVPPEAESRMPRLPSSGWSDPSSFADAARQVHVHVTVVVAAAGNSDRRNQRFWASGYDGAASEEQRRGDPPARPVSAGPHRPSGLVRWGPVEGRIWAQRAMAVSPVRVSLGPQWRTAGGRTGKPDTGPQPPQALPPEGRWGPLSRGWPSKVPPREGTSLGPSLNGHTAPVLYAAGQRGALSGGQ
jgi:hypothetical protein